jgi:hypothetical protein
LPPGRVTREACPPSPPPLMAKTRVIQKNGRFAVTIFTG